MGYQLTFEEINKVFAEWMRENVIYAPKLFTGSGVFSDTDLIRYGEISKVEEIVIDEIKLFI